MAVFFKALHWLIAIPVDHLLGLPDVPDFPGCPGFGVGRPASRLNPSRDAKCPGFCVSWEICTTITHKSIQTKSNVEKRRPVGRLIINFMYYNA